MEAGPCPVVAVRTPDADGYEGVQLAWEPVAERKISKAERGHLAANGVSGAYRHLVEFRGPRAGRERHRGDLPAGRQGEGGRDRHRQRLPGHGETAPIRPRPGDARI